MIHKNNKPFCTVNFHNTTSRMVITGRKENTLKFVKDHLPLINKKITENLDGHGISIAMLNQSIRVSLEETRSLSARKEHNTSKLSRKKPAITDAPSCPVQPCNSGAVAILQESCESPTVCPLCRFEVTGDATQCDICDQWTHRSSENISIHGFKNITQATPYTCSLCPHTPQR